MFTNAQIAQTDTDTDLAAEAAYRLLYGHGRLAALLAMRAPLGEVYRRRLALHTWAHVHTIKVTLDKLERLQEAVEDGTLTADASLHTLARLGVFHDFVREYRAALQLVRNTLDA